MSMKGLICLDGPHSTNVLSMNEVLYRRENVYLGKPAKNLIML